MDDHKSGRSEREVHGGGVGVLLFSVPTHLLPFFAGVQLSHDSLREFSDGIKIPENRGLGTVLEIIGSRDHKLDFAAGR